MINISHIIVLSQPHFLQRRVQSVLQSPEAGAEARPWRIWRRLRGAE
ncbi:MAG: hypothetical protein M3177_02105 [Pseudomonadota bacterium]|nr:hypothetical protein [Pseudomonadota bacterium]